MKKKYSQGIGRSYWLSNPISKTFQKSILTFLLLFSVSFANAQTFVIDGLQYTVITGTDVSVNKDGACPTGALTIPSLVTFGGTDYTVRTIENQAFSFCSALTSVTFGDSITSIADLAFYQCSGLTSVAFGDSLKSIGDRTFSDCSGLSSLTLPNSLNFIESRAFQYCSGLSSLTLPNSLYSIGYEAFQYCSGLTSVTFGDSLNSIGNNAFLSCSQLSSLTLPNSLNSIGIAAFRDCSGLSSLTLPNSLNSIGIAAFRNCSTLTEVTVDWQTPLAISSDVFLGVTLGGVTLKVPEGKIAAYEAASIWQNFSPIEENIVCFTIGNLKYTAVGSDTFVRVTKNGTCPTGALTIPSLVTDTSTNIEYTVRTIENEAFQYCSGLTSVTFGDSLNSIGNYAFYNCNGLTSVTFGDSLNSIGIAAFYQCNGLTSVDLPNSLNSIGNSTFRNCSGLSSLTLPNSLNSIGNSAFSSCSGLTSVTFGDSLNSIGDQAFKDCSGLTSVTFGDSLNSIGDRAFSGCNGLSSLTLPNSLYSIGHQAFQSCSGLSSLTLPNSLNSIGEFAFYSCVGLTSVTFGNSLNSIGDQAFRNCSGLTEVTVDWQTPLAISSDVFLGVTLGNVTLKVPEGEIATYEAVSVWTDFSPIRATHNFSQTACGSFEFGDSTYTVSGVYNDTITTTENNDSISRINLTILQIPDTNLIITACESFTFGDSTYINSGTYSDTLMAMAANGCDSVVTLNLTINNSNTGTDTQTACDSYTWIDGNTYTASNTTATHTLTNAAECDSIVTLNLTITNSNSGTDTQTACDSYTWIDGNTYTASNTTATHTLTNAAGCDSVLTLDLTILESTSSSFSFAGQDSVVWNSFVFTQSIDTSITIINSAGCDSVINISLVILPSAILHNQSFTICNGESIEVGNSVYTQAGIYIDTLMGANNDSIVTTTIVINGSLPNPTISHPFVLTLETEQGYNSYQWKLDGNDIDGANNYQLNITQGGSYNVVVENEQNCQGVSNPYNVATTDIEQVVASNTIAYPNPTKSTVIIESEKMGRYKVLNAYGKVILKGEKTSLKHEIDLSEFSNGLYLIRLNGKTHQIIKQ